MKTALSLSELRAFDSRAPERSGESDFCCPLCGGDKPVDQAHRALSVNLHSGIWHCHRCEQGGKLREFRTEQPPSGHGATSRRRLGSSREPLILPASASRNNVLVNDLLTIAARFPSLAGSPAADYLTGRGLPLRLCEDAGVRYALNWHGRPAALFSIVDQHGQEIAAQGRYLKPCADRPNFHTEGPKSEGVFVTPGAWEADEITITEAPIDALSLCLSGYPALALVGKSWPAWLPAFIAAMRKRIYLAFDADEPDSRGARAGDEAAEKLAAGLRYYDCYSERMRPGRAKDWNAQLLIVRECRRLCTLLARQIQFLEDDKPHPKLGRPVLLTRAWQTLNDLKKACVVADGPDAVGYDDAPLDPFAEDCLAMWQDALSRL